MPIVLSMRSAVDLPWDASLLRPDHLAEKTPAEIAQLFIRVGREPIPLGDLFAIHSESNRDELIVEGDLHAGFHLASELEKGTVIARGNVGPTAGRAMKGGTLTIHGSAGAGLGGGMQGGVIHLHGKAECDVGFDLAQRTPMTGGTIIIEQDAGRHVGRGMRRGTIAVRGSVGEEAMAGAVAGTLAVLGACGPRPGLGMRRGSLILFGAQEVDILPTFRRGRTIHPMMLTLLGSHLAHLGFHIDPHLLGGEMRIHHGDMLALGLGEILTPAGGGGS